MNCSHEKVFITSDAIDIFYLTKKHTWKQKLILVGDEFRLFENDSQLKDFIEKIGPKFLMVDFSKITTKEYFHLKMTFEKLTLIDGNPISSMRRIKSQDEIEMLKKSANLNASAMNFVISNLKQGITEMECANLYEIYIREHQGQKSAFDPICSFGSNTQYVHHKPGNRALEVGDFVTLDFGCILNHYASDMTRSFRFDNEERSNFEIVIMEAQKLALSMCKPLEDFKKIQKCVDDFFQEKGVLNFKKHSLGHGVGLNVHEEPFIGSEDTILKEGMCITIEPGLYKPGEYGFRYEDTILITNKGYMNFYESWNWAR